MKAETKLRLSNWLLLIAMIIFALLLAVGCFLWMHGVMTAREAAKRASQIDPALQRLVSPVRCLS